MKHSIIIPLSQGKTVIIDAEDLPLVSGYSWCAMKGTGGWYAGTWIGKRPNRKLIYMHNVIMSPPDGMQVDHIDHDGLNCRKANMRHATRSQNCANRKRRAGKNPYKGIWQQKSGRWASLVGCRRKNTYLGTFDSPEEAARAYDAAARECHGEFATLNFPGEGS